MHHAQICPTASCHGRSSVLPAVHLPALRAALTSGFDEHPIGVLGKAKTLLIVNVTPFKISPNNDWSEKPTRISTHIFLSQYVRSKEAFHIIINGLRDCDISHVFDALCMLLVFCCTYLLTECIVCVCVCV